MLKAVAKIRRVVLTCGTVNLFKGIDSLSMIIGDKYHQNPFEKRALFLFCGKHDYFGWSMDFSCSTSVLM